MTETEKKHASIRSGIKTNTVGSLPSVMCQCDARVHLGVSVIPKLVPSMMTFHPTHLLNDSLPP